MVGFQTQLQTTLADSDDVPSALVNFWNNVWKIRVEEEVEKLKGSEISESERRGAEEVGVVWDRKVKLGCEAKPDLLDNPYEKSQIEYWYQELEKIAPG